MNSNAKNGNRTLKNTFFENSSTSNSQNNCETRSPIRRKWLTTKEAAEYLGTTPGGIRTRVYRQQLRPHKPFGRNGKSYFKREELDRLMESPIDRRLYDNKKLYKK